MKIKVKVESTELSDNMQSLRVCERKILHYSFRGIKNLRVVHVQADSQAYNKNSIDLALAKKVGKIEFIKDNETTANVFSISGPLIERVHGRLAMWGFFLAVITELSRGIGIIEQLQLTYINVLITNGLIFLGSVAPKYSAGVSLQDLNEAASADNGQQFIVFNNEYEIWAGRVAMVGIIGLLLTEVFVKGGKALF
eukprot:TRINITY_DN4689_c0_g1_i5.p2 TRINITY_DN4689_c0_g1~~TRINITY_DN4689_c0_g1_i5.p2  ORF type:complete len:226 (-),score=20.60 TRINITY_DN4689_c0_g1_i5:211-798(-)